MNECAVSTELLAKNGLSVGDTISVASKMILSDISTGRQKERQIGWDLLITGAYIDNTSEYANSREPQNAFLNRRNEILVTADTLAVKVEKDWQGINVTAKYLLRDPDLQQAFTAELRGKGLSDIWDVIVDADGYKRIVNPVQGLKTISIVFVFVILTFGAIIIALLASIAIRERKYEIGVLRAMGMKRMRVTMGLWLEILLITAVCLAVGLGVGVLAAQPVADMIIGQQASAAGIAEQPAGACPLTVAINASIEQTPPLSSLDVSLGWKTVVQIIFVSLLLSSLSGFVSTVKITKYEPIRILIERD
jgi:putative ABC transport system permease protein